MFRLTPLALLWTAGCAVVDAPEDLEDLVVFGFTHFELEDHQTATVDGLQPLARDLHEPLTDGYRVDSLTALDLEEAGISAQDDDGSEIFGISAKVALDASLQDIAETWTHHRMQEVFESTVTFDVQHEEGDRDCFLSRADDCRSYAIEGHRGNDNGFFGTTEQDFRREFGWVVLDDGSEAFVMRDLVPTPAEISVSFLRIDQQYSYTVFFEDGDGVTQIGSFWVDALAIGLDVPDAFALDWAVHAMNADADQILAFIDAG